MKKLIFFLSIFLPVAIALSQTYYLNVNLKDGTRVVYLVADIDKIDFSGIPSGLENQKFKNIVKSFKLMQNYPNPFNPSTTIQYEIPEPGKVEVSVYDINGRLINNIVNQTQQAGTYKAVWKGINHTGQKVSSGLYFYTVKFDNKIFSKKMILLK